MAPAEPVGQTLFIYGTAIPHYPTSLHNLFITSQLMNVKPSKCNLVWRLDGCNARTYRLDCSRDLQSLTTRHSDTSSSSSSWFFSSRALILLLHRSETSSSSSSMSHTSSSSSSSLFRHEVDCEGLFLLRMREHFPNFQGVANHTINKNWHCGVT